SESERNPHHHCHNGRRKERKLPKIPSPLRVYVWSGLFHQAGIHFHSQCNAWPLGPRQGQVASCSRKRPPNEWRSTSICRVCITAMGSLFLWGVAPTATLMRHYSSHRCASHVCRKI